MTDVNFSVPAKLLTSRGQIGLPPARDGGPIDHGSLGRMVSKVMDAAPEERERYFIFADGGAYLHTHEIEALASTRRYADWHAGQA